MNWLIIIYIVVPNLFFYFLFRGRSYAGSDHALHVKHIDRIKANRHRFLEDYFNSFNEKNIAYPQLYHWLLSFLPAPLYTEKFYLVGYTVKILEVISFNLFLISLQSVFKFPDTYFLYTNIVFNVFPFNYVAWNAKNMGLSARGLGLLAGQVYTYLLVAYLIQDSYLILAGLLLSIFVILLLSQMALQYVILTLPLAAIVFRVPELLLLPVIGFGLYFGIMPRVAKNFVIGQFNHKRNYALFLGEIFILRIRYSIWRDLVYDFWKKLREEPRKIRVFNYIITNPVVEVVYGMPFLWLSIGMFYCFSPIAFKDIPAIQYMVKIILIACGAFILTSFRRTRFLGEPQRYLEFVFPLASLLFVMLFPLKTMIICIGIATILIVVYLTVINKHKSAADLGTDFPLSLQLLTFLNESCPEESVIISNDFQLIKALSAGNFLPLIPCLTDYYKDKEAFQMQFYNGRFEIISPTWIKQSIQEYHPTVVLINTDFYHPDLLSEADDFFRNHYALTRKIESVEIYIRRAS